MPRPELAPAPARPTNEPEPTVVENKDAPTIIQYVFRLAKKYAFTESPWILREDLKTKLNILGVNLFDQTLTQKPTARTPMKYKAMTT